MSAAAIPHEVPARSAWEFQRPGADGVAEQRFEARRWLGHWWTDIEAVPIVNAMVAWSNANPEADERTKRRAYAWIAWRLS